MNHLFYLQLFTSLFLAILYLQSGIDKIINWKGEIGWIAPHFSKTFLKNMVPMMLLTVTILEVAAGTCSGIGVAALLVNGDTDWGFYGAFLAAVNVCSLFFGQRIAKDYAGAASLVSYFVMTMIALYVYTV